MGKIERDFSNIDVTPGDIVQYMFNNSYITLSRYIQWLKTDHSWKSVKDVFLTNMIDKAKLQ